MASLRDLFVTFGIRYDDKGARKADKDLDKLKSKARGAAPALGGAAKQANTGFLTLGRTIAGIGAGLGLNALAGGVKNVLAAASSAEEVDNQLSVLFGAEGTARLKEFSDATAKEMKRSTYEVQRFASTIGALLVPEMQSMGAEGVARAQEMSQNLGKLAFDLASFVEGTTEEEALTALRSGVSGESEPLKRFGINLTEAGIASALGMSEQAVRAAKGPEKVLLRYNAIMERSAVAQGDAARSADTYKGSANALKSTFLTLATEMGKVFLPIATKVLQWTRAAIDGIRWLGKNTMIFETIAIGGLIVALGALGLAFNATAGSAIIAWLATLGPLLIVIAAVASLILFFEDLWVGMNGGKSVIGEFLDDMLGVKNSLVVLRETFEGIGAAIYDAFHGGSVATSEFWDTWLMGLGDIQKKWDEFSSALEDSALWKVINAASGGTFGLIKKILPSISEASKKVGGMIAGPSAGANQAEVQARATALRQRLGLTGDVVGGARNFEEARANATFARPTPNMSTANNTTVNVNVTGASNPRETGREVERATRNALAEDRRRTSRGIR